MKCNIKIKESKRIAFTDLELWGRFFCVSAYLQGLGKINKLLEVSVDRTIIAAQVTAARLYCGILQKLVKNGD
ncbi:hypothetical protein [Muricomes intestini]|jgi:hypothetical protein|uniref:hypothetical protein n=1 Tax=Muricomes intestini TaxID=1796634 RepID=UPI002FE12E9B